MKFSYKLLKKYLPNLLSEEKVVDALNMHAFEADLVGDGLFDISIPHNRYSDAASHIGLAREVAAVLDITNNKIPALTQKIEASKPANLSVKIKEKDLCTRYIAGVFDGVVIKESPEWIKEVLVDCGLKPINVAVDIMNYAMLEVGQPLHAFDLEKIRNQEIIVRFAKNEKIKTLDGVDVELGSDHLVIADSKGPMAIAGIKGGEKSGVTEETNHIVVEAANFKADMIYKTSKNLGISTDASLRFSHDLHPSLTMLGFLRAKELLQDVASARLIGFIDTAPSKPTTKTINFEEEKINHLLGTDLSSEEIKLILGRLRLEMLDNKILIPPLRTDLETWEDVAEEVARMIGYNNIISRPPLVGISSPYEGLEIKFRDTLRDYLFGFGFDEVYLSSFTGVGENNSVELENPISKDKKYLRSNIVDALAMCLEKNLQVFPEAKIFEMGHVFSVNKKNLVEKSVLGIALASPNNSFLKLKGSLSSIIESLGITEFVMQKDNNNTLNLASGGEDLGFLRRINDELSVVEIDLKKLFNVIEGDSVFVPIPKYPASERDVSVFISSDVLIGDLIQEVQISNVNLIEDVDLIDEYLDTESNKQSITLRIVFRANDHTLKSSEVDSEMDKINSILIEKFEAEVRG